MARFQYDGEAEMVFPTIGVTVKKGEQFDAPDDFKAVGVSAALSVKQEIKKAVSQSSAPSDTTAGE
jgi:hypothetical protein